MSTDVSQSPPAKLKYAGKDNVRTLIPHSRRHTLDGSIFFFLCEGLMFPSGLLVSIYLTHIFKQDGFGLFTVIASTASWLEMTISAIFTRAGIKVIGDAHDLPRTGSAVLRVYLISGCIGGAILFIFAGPIAEVMHEERLVPFLRLFALDVPIFALAQGYRGVLIGLGRFRQRAAAAASRWIVRLLVIVGCVAAGFGLRGAIIGCIVASIADLLIASWRSPVSIFHSVDGMIHQVWLIAAPLMGEAICLRCYDRLDFFALKRLGGTAAAAGVYGVAQNLSLLPQLFGWALSPLLLSSMTRALRVGDRATADQLGRTVLRILVMLFPLVAIISGAGTEIVVLFFKSDFAAAGPILSILVFGALMMVIMSVCVSILVAGVHPSWALYLSAPLPFIAVVGHLLIVPKFQGIGAASVNTATSCLGAIVAMIVVARKMNLLPPLATCLRSAAMTIVVYYLAQHWPASGLMLLVKLGAISLFCVLGFFLMGELPKLSSLRATPAAEPEIPPVEIDPN